MKHNVHTYNMYITCTRACTMSAHYMYKQKYNQCAFHGFVYAHEIDMDITYLKIAATHVCECHVGRTVFNTVLIVFALCDCTNFGRNDKP